VQGWNYNIILKKISFHHSPQNNQT
jgi:hypothetical protein